MIIIFPSYLQPPCFPLQGLAQSLNEAVLYLCHVFSNNVSLQFSKKIERFLVV